MRVTSRLRLWSDKVAQAHRQLKGSLSVDKIARKEGPADDLIPLSRRLQMFSGVCREVEVHV